MHYLGSNSEDYTMKDQNYVEALVPGSLKEFKLRWN